MSKKSNLKPIAAAFGVIFAVSLAVSPVANAADNPFGMTELSKGGYMIAAATTKYERDAETYIKQGDAKFHERDYEGAIADWSLAIARKPDNAKTYYKRGVALFYVAKFNPKSLYGGDYEGAIADFDRAIELKPDYAEAHYSRGVAKYFEGDFEGAIAIPDYDRAIELKPDYANAYYDRGHAKYQERDYEGAMADYNRAIELDPEYAVAYYKLGELKRYQLDDYYGAIADYSRAIELLNQGDKFVSRLSRAIELYPDNMPDPDVPLIAYLAYRARGHAKSALGDSEGAKEDFKRADELNLVLEGY